MTKSWIRLSIITACASLIVGCTTEQTGPAEDSDVGPTYNGPAEATYCSTVNTFGSPITVTGDAEFLRRNIWGNTVSGGLGGATTGSTHPATAHPIRYAEIRVTDAAGNVVQCGETLVDGSFSVTLPQGNTNYTFSINSRSFNNKLRASVLNRVEQNRFYSLSTTVNASANVNVGTLTAPANGTILGAAFNILDQLLDANEFLRDKVGTCGYTGCPDFTVAPKAFVYWEKGFNPNSYFGGTSGLSFYLPGYSRLFILGGRNGDVDNSDTDHFDQSVILHEYGHFLEDVEFVSDSPGGPHSGNAVIDPRLAWSEGWGNFFQAAVQSFIVGGGYTPRYIDTFGNDDGSTDMLYFADLENQVTGNDIPTEFTLTGEGNFREFSVTRLLWDAIDSNNEGGGETISNQFANIWAVLKKTSRGFKDSTFAFRNIGLFHLGQVWTDTNDGGQTWTSLRTIENQRADTSDYGQYVVTAGCAAGNVYPYQILPVTDTSSQLQYSNLFRNNKFYHLKIASAGTYTIQLISQDANGAGIEADLDLYLYNESARFANSNDMVRYSINDPDGNPATTETESISVSVPAGNYLINVNAYTGSSTGTLANFNLRINGSNLCPGNIIP